MIATQLEEIVHQKCEEENWTDCFLIELSISPQRDVEVIIDADAGVTFEQCKMMSRHIENWLDTNSVLTDDYTLEVSSPGINRPLKFARQYPRNIGRTLEITYNEPQNAEILGITEGVKIVGILKAIDTENITIEWEDIKKEGKKKIKEIKIKEIPFSNIQKAIVQIVF